MVESVKLAPGDTIEQVQQDIEWAAANEDAKELKELRGKERKLLANEL